MLLLQIFLATLLTGVGSVWLAAWLMRLGSTNTQHLLSLAAGALLATAFMHLLPEAFDGRHPPQRLFAVLLAGLVFFFLLDKAELWHHGHEHHHGAHEHAHHHHDPHHHHSHSGSAGGWAVLLGDSLHGFGDGILIASAFAADPSLGMVAALAVLAHEVPHHVGDLIVVRQSSGTRRMALMKVSLAGAVTVLGGMTGYWLLGRLQAGLPLFLVVASSSFVYVALADLIPQLQRQLSLRLALQQIAWLLAGVGLVALASRLASHHS